VLGYLPPYMLDLNLVGIQWRMIRMGILQIRFTSESSERIQWRSDLV